MKNKITSLVSWGLLFLSAITGLASGGLTGMVYFTVVYLAGWWLYSIGMYTMAYMMVTRELPMISVILKELWAIWLAPFRE